jgi:hypothetical protein
LYYLQSVSDVALQGMMLLGIPVKRDFSRPHRLCLIRFSSVEIPRRAEIQAVFRDAEARHKRHLKNERQTNPIQAVFAAPGGGKSRFLDQLADAVRGIGESCLRGSVVLPISYNGVVGTPSSVDKRAGTPHDFGLAARILWSHFAERGVDAYQFSRFFRHMLEAVPDMDHFQAVEAVMGHQGTDRVLLLVDELIKTEQVAEDRPFGILSTIGELLDTFIGFNAVVASLKPSPIIRQKSAMGRSARWVPLAPFTLRESLEIMQPALEKHAHLGKGDVLRMLVSDVGGHPRGLEVLAGALDKHLKPGMRNTQIVEAVVAEFCIFSSGLGPLCRTAVRMALRGELIPLSEPVGSSTLEGLTASGVFLNSEVCEVDVTSIVPRLSIMLLRVFCACWDYRDRATRDLVECVAETALQNEPRFEWDDAARFHAQCEVLVRLAGCTGRKSLAEFYTRGDSLLAPKAIRDQLIEFCTKTDGVIGAQDRRSIFHGFDGRPSCRAVHMAGSGQEGFDMVAFEEKAGGGHVAIFVDTKHRDHDAEPDSEATTTLESEEARRKWARCLAWRENSEAAGMLGIGPGDCFLVLASWNCRSEPMAAIQAREALEDESHILVLGRAELARFYTPTLVSRRHLIAGRDLVRVGVEGPAASGPAAAQCDGLSLQAEVRDPNP